MKKRLVFIIGPTAAGKTDIAISLAKKIRAEIISCDSMQLYKGMDIIAAKPSPKQLKSVKHHLISVIPPSEEHSAWQYRKAVLKIINQIISKDKIPLFVGGTGLYLSALLDGIFKSPPIKKGLRESLYKQAKKFGCLYMHERLKAVDPLAAGKIHPHDLKKTIRALEVFLSTNKPISQLQKNRRGLEGKFSYLLIGINMPRSLLYARINARVDRMFKQGLEGEVRRLLALKLSKTACVAIGIKELKGYLENSYGLKQAKDLIKRNTRHYAKRQLTWFKKDKRVQWINIGRNQKPAAIAEKLWKKYF